MTMIQPTPKDWIICAFCMTVMNPNYGEYDIISCPNCKEYKGLSTIAEWEKYSGELYDEGE
jgi:hypothetical protein